MGIDETAPDRPISSKDVRSYCLSFHSGYRCRHSGACCTANWPISIEPDTLSWLRTAHAFSDRTRLIEPHTDADGRPLLAKAAGGACIFYEGDSGGLCAIHREAGPAALPSACRNFPRVALRDGRGVFITLSHYCPTAAALLLEAQDISIVDAPSSISLDGGVEGLDATAVMPPLLGPGMLTDLNGYAAWEARAIRVLNDRAYPPRVALAILDEATDDACRWRPGQESLTTRVTHAFDRACPRHARETRRNEQLLERPMKAFLAAHLFASWAAYQSGGPTAVVRSVQSAFEMLELALDRASDSTSFISAVRAVDLRLRHGSATPDS